MTQAFEINWHTAFEPTVERQDAVWYYGHNLVATATLTTENGEQYSLDIYCDGETKFRIPYKDADGDFDFTNCAYVRYESDWAEHGVTTDAEMQALLDTLMNEHEYEAHIYNSWFDLYTEIDGVSEHLDSVTHEIGDAVSQAEAVLQEVAAHGSWGAYLAHLAA